MTAEGWPPPIDQVWLVDGTQGAVVKGHTMSGEPVDAVAVRVASRLNLDPRNVDDERTFLLDGDSLVELLVGLMMCGNRAFGPDFVRSAFAEALGVAPPLRDATLAAVDRAIAGLDRDLGHTRKNGT